MGLYHFSLNRKIPFVTLQPKTKNVIVNGVIVMVHHAFLVTGRDRAYKVQCTYGGREDDTGTAGSVVQAALATRITFLS